MILASPLLTGILFVTNALNGVLYRMFGGMNFSEFKIVYYSVLACCKELHSLVLFANATGNAVCLFPSVCRTVLYLWRFACARDISRRVMLSAFCSMDYNIFQSVVLGVVSQCGCGKMNKNFTDCKLPDEVEYTDDFKDNIFNNIVPGEHQESRLRINHACSHLDFNEENIAVCLLVLVTPPDIDKIQINQDENCDELKKKGSWRFALLEDKVLLLGDTLDARTSVASVLSQNGVIGTSDGHIYTWEVMNGRKVFTSKDFEGVSISCISADPTSTAFAVAGSDNRVLLYVQLTES